MPDLWKALGDVYGERDADAPPVPREASASERSAAMPLDDDLAAALSAALVNAPTPGTPGAPVAPPAPSYDYAAPAAMPAPVAPMPPIAPPPAPAPAAAPAYAYAPPAAAAPAAPPAGDRVNSWIAEIDERNRRRDEGPDLAATQFPVWSRSDDDILPVGAKKRRLRK